jgi:hypothetical protein
MRKTSLLLLHVTWNSTKSFRRPSDDGKIIILDDSNDETEAREEKTAGIEPTTTPTSADLALSAPTNADDAPVGAKIGNSDDQGPDQEADGGNDDGRSTGEP